MLYVLLYRSTSSIDCVPDLYHWLFALGIAIDLYPKLQNCTSPLCLVFHIIVHEFESVIHRVSVNRETGAIVEMQDCGGRADVDYVSFNGGL